MLTARRNGIAWFLEDEDLIALVEGLIEGVRPRRTHEFRNRGGRGVFVKYFVEKGLLGFVRNRVYPRGKREYLLGRRLSSRSIPTPRPLGYGRGKRGSFILQERIDALPFKSAFDKDRQRERLLDDLALLLKRLGAERIRHNDLHLENIMVARDGLYLIDLHKTDVLRVRFSRADELMNMTHALTMIYDTMTEAEKKRFFDVYGRPDIRPFLEEGLQRLWHRWIDSKKRRAFSTTSKLVVSGNRVYVRGRETCAQGAFRESIKKDRKVTVARHGDHIRKTYRNRRRLTRAWRAHVVLEYLDMDVLPQAFYVQTASLFRSGFIAMEDLHGRGVEADRFLDREYDGMTCVQRRRFAHDLSEFLDRLLKKGIAHKDLKACNLFVLPDGFRLIDVEDIEFAAPSEETLERMLVQLNTSVPERITLPDRIRFFLEVTEAFSFDRKRLFRNVVQASRDEDIVYEGVSGLKRESWQGHRRGSPSPFSPPHRL